MKNIRLGYLSTMYHTSHMIKHLKWIEEDLERTEENGRIVGADASKVSQRAKKRGLSQVGTLGAGLIRWEAGDRQVSGAKIAVAENGGGFYGVEEAATAVTVLAH